MLGDDELAAYRACRSNYSTALLNEWAWIRERHADRMLRPGVAGRVALKHAERARAHEEHAARPVLDGLDLEPNTPADDVHRIRSAGVRRHGELDEETHSGELDVSDGRRGVLLSEDLRRRVLSREKERHQPRNEVDQLLRRSGPRVPLRAAHGSESCGSRGPVSRALLPRRLAVSVIRPF
jgi:hypothetical protein